MATVQYAHICDYAFLTEQSGPCIIGIFEHLQASQYPIVLPLLTIAVQLYGASSEEVEVEVAVCRADGSVLAQTSRQWVLGDRGRYLGIPSPIGGAFMNIQMFNTRFPEPGNYSVMISAAGAVLKSLPLALLLLKRPN